MIEKPPMGKPGGGVRSPALTQKIVARVAATNTGVATRNALSFIVLSFLFSAPC
jgi:hypothetical protein